MRRAARVAFAGLAMLLASPAGAAAADRASTRGDSVASIPVSFEVRNVNRSGLACRSDGRPYRLSGRLIGPAGVVGRSVAPAATLYVHEFSYGSFFWSLPELPRYDYAAIQARAGHASVVIDRLGYDGSPHPHGMATCLGAHADMVHQVVVALRAGTYRAGGRRPVAFRRIALAGHSIGGGVSELSAYSFGGIDALVLVNWADQGFTPASLRHGLEQGQRCAAGGDPAEPGTPSGYAHFIQSEARFRFYQFHAAEPSVADAVVRRRNRDPCGDSMSLPSLTIANAARVREIRVPVLIVFGRQSRSWDAAAAARRQRELFAGSRDVEVRLVDRAVHALPFERSAPTTRRAVSEWLCKHLAPRRRCGRTARSLPRRRARLRLRVRPTRVRVGRRCLLARVTGRRGPVRGARVRLAGEAAGTGRRGRARLCVRLRHARSYTARAWRRGYAPGRATVRVAGRNPRFTGKAGDVDPR